MSFRKVERGLIKSTAKAVKFNTTRQARFSSGAERTRIETKSKWFEFLINKTKFFFSLFERSTWKALAEFFHHARYVTRLIAIFVNISHVSLRCDWAIYWWRWDAMFRLVRKFNKLSKNQSAPRSDKNIWNISRDVFDPNGATISTSAQSSHRLHKEDRFDMIASSARAAIKLFHFKRASSTTTTWQNKVQTIIII